MEQTPAPSQAIAPDNPALLKHQIDYVQFHLNASGQRRDRLKDLMERRSSRRWSPAKKARMVRRLVAASRINEQCTVAIGELVSRLEQALAAIGMRPVNNVAPFVPPPATSVNEQSTGPGDGT